jgi:acyl-CoA synthetase (AMP-forming)/AMP-acid ligase II
MTGNWLNLGEMIEVNAFKYPETILMKDANRSYTYPEVNRRINKLANAITGLGLQKGDKMAVLLENTLEICELYFAACRNGVVIVPIMFRLIGKDIGYIVENSEAKAFFVMDEFIPNLPEELPTIPEANRIVIGQPTEGWKNYDEFLESGSEEKPDVDVQPEDTWIMLYTSGTTGVPKGVVRSHGSYVAFYLINAIDFKFHHGEMCLNIMPICHVNSTFFTFNFTYMGGTFYVQPARSFRALEIFEIIEREKVNFISLIPTHYNIILSADREEAKKYDVSSVTKLLCSSAPVSPEMKKEIMEFFSGVDLYEGYGSTEAGIVTTLFPEEQYDKTGSIGRESSATAIIKLLDEDGNPTPQGEVGELYSYGPMLFDEYWKLPEKTESSFIGKFFTAGDMARMDEDGYYEIVDRKDNMIITGGEHVYPTEVENIICQHPAVYDAAILGIPDDKWGEAVKAVVVLKEGQEATDEEIMEFCRGKMAGFKRPKSVDFIKEEEMPRTGSGKKLHRALREKYL